MRSQWFPFRMLHPQVWYCPANNIGPLLFLLYINDLPNCLSHTEPRMYADDIHLTYSNGNIHSIQSSQNEDLLNINRWLTANKLILNRTKTEFMLIGSRQKLNNLPSLPSLNINNFPIKHSQCSKSIGVLIDETLTRKNHVDALSKKIASVIAAIKRINHCLPLLPFMMYIMALSYHTLTVAAWYLVAVVKLCVLNCSGSRTVRHAFSQTPIMM